MEDSYINLIWLNPCTVQSLFLLWEGKSAINEVNQHRFINNLGAINKEKEMISII
jgi:hypothetical protein